MRLEKMGHSVERIAHPFAFDVDIAAVQKGFAEVVELSKTWSGYSNDSIAMKLSAKLCYLLGQVNRAVILNDDE